MMIRLVLAALILLVSASSASASNHAISPTGSWASANGESRFTVTLCGDGTELCARLVWLRKDMRTAENMAYLNAYVIRRARAVGANRWRGTVNVYGERTSGRIELVDNARMRLVGCRLVLCQSFEFKRI
ncbi:MAG: DUF2147 domain-containing protein [Alphaproteobacteria bacterium]|nr:DUF2147 domain-containing protein [Alphaproteobacteria bacterium]